MINTVGTRHARGLCVPLAVIPASGNSYPHLGVLRAYARSFFRSCVSRVPCLLLSLSRSSVPPSTLVNSVPSNGHQLQNSVRIC